jgi:hypothetical protein
LIQGILQVPVHDVLPSMGAILEGQGIPRWVHPDERTLRLAQDALSLYIEAASPVGAVMEISREQFTVVFDGEGRNDDASPVGPIFRASDDLALFAVTLGEKMSQEISRKFENHDFALGTMLDAAASEGAEMAALVLENSYRRHLLESGRFDRRHGTLRFSPGYCGWHISAQKELFQTLEPDKIGITLNESYLMTPIKSISGVIISGRKSIFDFEDVFSFCRDCATHSCRERVRALSEQ